MTKICTLNEKGTAFFLAPLAGRGAPAYAGAVRGGLQMFPLVPHPALRATLSPQAGRGSLVLMAEERKLSL